MHAAGDNSSGWWGGRIPAAGANNRATISSGGQLAVNTASRYYVFLVVMFGGLGFVTIAMAAIGVWLFRRNRRLPRLVKGRRLNGSGTVRNPPPRRRTR
jgi:hypothetical protein